MEAYTLRSEDRPRFTTSSNSRSQRFRGLRSTRTRLAPSPSLVPVDPRQRPQPSMVPADPRQRPQPRAVSRRPRAVKQRVPWSVAACRAWNADPTRNPLTKRKIKETAAMYRRIKGLCEVGRTPGACRTMSQNNTRHPLTKRKLITTAKNGLYVQLREICASRSPTPQRSSNHARLIAAIRKTIRPLLRKGDDVRSRIKYAGIVRRYLEKSFDPAAACLSKATSPSNKLALKDAQEGKDLIVFDNRIGTKSLYGVAHLHAGRGFHRLVKFASKIMVFGTQSHDIEVGILKMMTEAVEKYATPNFPITYSVGSCSVPCKGRACPKPIKREPYYVILNELADMDLQKWHKTRHTEAEHASVIAQMMLGLYAFHRMGFAHEDAHLGNFLIHKVTPGGYWWYRVDGINVYVENLGSLLVLWDPGRAEVAPMAWKDYNRPLHLMHDMQRLYPTKKYGRMYQPPQPVRDMILDVMHENSGMPEDGRMQYAMISIASKFDAVRIADRAPGRLLNVKPFLVTLSPNMALTFLTRGR